MRLRITKEGFEPAEEDVSYRLPELALQRVVRLNAGEAVTPWGLVSSHDVNYVVAGRTCFPCRLIRVVVPHAGTVGVRVTWTVPSSELTLFVEGQIIAGTSEVIVEVPIDGPREVIMYVGGASPGAVRNYTPFRFETSMR